MKLFKNPLFYLCLILVLVSGMMVVSFVKAQSGSKAWEEPAEQFPGGVTGNPIDESSDFQFKIEDDAGNGQLGAYEIGIPNASGKDLREYPKMTEDSLCLKPGVDGAPSCISKWSQVSGAWTSGDNGLYYNGGNVGIGTTNPSLSSNATGLNIAGEAGQKDQPQDGEETIPMLRITDLVTDYGSDTATPGEKRGGIEFYSNETSGSITGVVSAIYDVNENAYNTRHGLAFYTAANGAPREVMRINQYGRVGIGTTEPSNSLHVNGNGVILSRDGSLSARMGVTSDTKRFFIAPAESDGDGWNYHKEITFDLSDQMWNIEGGVNIKGDIYQNGDVFEGGGGDLSDVNLKELINFDTKIVMESDKSARCNNFGFPCDKTANVVASCPSGYVILGGGCEILDGAEIQEDGGMEAGIQKSAPKNQGWNCKIKGRVTNNKRLEVEAHAVCGRLSVSSIPGLPSKPLLNIDVQEPETEKTYISSLQINVSWGVVDNADSYELKRESEQYVDGNWVLSEDYFETYSSNESRERSDVIDLNFNEEKLVKYYIRACNNKGCSAWSEKEVTLPSASSDTNIRQ